MTRPSTPPILSKLRSASSSASQVKALRDLKNEVIGHEQKKELWVGLGILTPLARILNSHKGSGKKKHRDTNASGSQLASKAIKSDEEEARLQAVIVVGSLAHGGPAFIPPIYAGHLISPLLALLSPTESHPQIILEGLRTLNTVADSLCLSKPDHDDHEWGLLNTLYSEQYLSNITNLLLQPSPSLVVKQQIALTASLIFKTCRDDYHRAMLAQVGTLEALAVNLAPWIIATGRSLGSGNEYAPGSGTPHDFLDMNSHSRLSPILHAIGAIIQNSRPRTMQFLSAPALTSAFTKLEADAGCAYERRPAWDTGISNPFNNRQAPPSVVESLIPPLPSSHFRSSLAPQSSFPPLGGMGTLGRQSQASRSFSSAIEVIQSHGLDFVGEEESPLVTWLMHAFRISDEETGLMAAWVLAILYRQGLTKRSKEAAIALLLVPSLVRMLDRDSDTFLEAPTPYDNSILVSPEKAVKEMAPAVLAMLTANSLETQKAAADAGVIKKLSQLLKQSYNPRPINPFKSMWTAESSSPIDSESPDDASRLGRDGVSPTVYHILRLRETVLVALAAMASNKDEYRKAIIENGVIPFVIKTLKADASESLKSSRHTDKDEPTNDQRLIMGNCRDAVLAACGAARALSRSVATLRTSLMDAGLSAPLFVLIKSQDIEIKVAATAVVCNLVLEFSPMREAIFEGGILKILCEHAHSMNANLRLNSMWALKHLIVGAANPVKMRCLEELGPGWLKQIVNNDREAATMTMRNGDREDGYATPIILSTPNAAGVQVDLLNAVKEDSRDSSQDLEEDEEEDLKMSDGIEGLSRADLDRERNTRPSQEFHGRGAFLEIGDSDLAKVTDTNANQGVSDEIAIQKQGLEFIRNLLCGPESYEMVDYLFTELGQDRFFDLLAAKLRPRVLNAFNRDRRSSENGVKCIQPVADLVISVCYILVHIAAGLPRHRQLLVSQTELLNIMVPLFSHPSREVRSSCAWFVINLTWVEDQSDNMNCKARARELAKLGFFEKLEGMEKDESLDCRERCKTALNQMSGLLRMS